MADVVCILAPVRISPSIRRTHQTRRIHLPPIQVLVLEFGAVDADGARAIAVLDVASLHHEIVYHPMERCFLVGQAIVLASA